MKKYYSSNNNFNKIIKINNNIILTKDKTIYNNKILKLILTFNTVLFNNKHTIMLIHNNKNKLKAYLNIHHNFR